MSKQPMASPAAAVASTAPNIPDLFRNQREGFSHLTRQTHETNMQLTHLNTQVSHHQTQLEGIQQQMHNVMQINNNNNNNSSTSVATRIDYKQAKNAALCDELRRIPQLLLDTTFEDKIDAGIEILQKVARENPLASTFLLLFARTLWTVKEGVRLEAKQRCTDLVNEVRNLIVGFPSFFFSNNRVHVNTLTSLVNALREVESLIENFLPRKLSELKDEAYWLNCVKSYDGKFDTLINLRLRSIKRDIEKIKPTSLDLTPEYSALEQQAKWLDSQDQVLEILHKIQEETRDWYNRYFTIEFFDSSPDSKKSFDLKDLYVELKIMKHQNNTTATSSSSKATNNNNNSNNNEALASNTNFDDVGETVADSKSLNQYLDRSKLVLVEGAAGIGKTVFCKQLCVLQNLQDSIAIFVPLKQLFGYGPITSIVDLLVAIEAPISVKDTLPEIIRYKIPIIWILDGYDEVMLTDDPFILDFLHNLLDPTTRNRHLTSYQNERFQLVRECDSVILTSRENRKDTNAVALSNLKEDWVRPDLWIIQRWQRPAIEDFVEKFFVNVKAKISVEDFKSLVDHSLGLQMQGFHGIPLFVKLLCEAWVEDSGIVDFSKISPPFLYQRTLTNALKRAKTRINHVLASQSKEIFQRYRSDVQHLTLYQEEVLPNACQLAFSEYLKHRGTVLTFSIPNNNQQQQLPLWIQIMREMGVLLNDSNDDTRFKFQHRTFLEFLAAKYVSLFPKENLKKVPFEDELDTTWLLICQMACTEHAAQQQQQQLQQKVSLSVETLCLHVAEKFTTLYKNLPDARKREKSIDDLLLKNLESKNGEDDDDEEKSPSRFIESLLEHQTILRAAAVKDIRLKLVIQIAEALPRAMLLDKIIDLQRFWHDQDFLSWAVEWCGWYGAISVLEWIEHKFPKYLEDKDICRAAYCRALQRQNAASQTKKCILFLMKYVGDLSLRYAIETNSHVALSEVLMRQDGKDKENTSSLISAFYECFDRVKTNPNLLATLFFFTKKEDLATLRSSLVFRCFFALPTVAEIWNPTKRNFEQVDAKHPDFLTKFDFVAQGKTFKEKHLLAAARIFHVRPWVLTTVLHYFDFEAIAASKLSFLTSLWMYCLFKSESFTVSDLWNSKDQEFEFVKLKTLLKKAVPCFPVNFDRVAITYMNLSVFPDALANEDLHCLESLKSLNRLSLSGCRNINDAGVKQIANLSSLQSLDLSSCAKITEIGIEHLAKLTLLRSLNLHNCPKISEEQMKKLKEKLANVEFEEI